MTNYNELINYIKKNIDIDDDDLKIVLSHFKKITLLSDKHFKRGVSIAGFPSFYIS